jgi:hypothetical protein
LLASAGTLCTFLNPPTVHYCQMCNAHFDQQMAVIELD